MSDGELEYIAKRELENKAAIYTDRLGSSPKALEPMQANTPRAGESEEQDVQRDLPRTKTLAIGTPEGLIETRGQTHGDYSNTSKYIQQLKTIAYGAYFERRQRNQPALTSQQKESLEMILHKCGRILSGDASFPDHWDDIAGYAKLANKEY